MDNSLAYASDAIVFAHPCGVFLISSDRQLLRHPAACPWLNAARTCGNPGRECPPPPIFVERLRRCVGATRNSFTFHRPWTRRVGCVFPVVLVPR